MTSLKVYNNNNPGFFTNVTTNNGITSYTLNGDKTLVSNISIYSNEELIINNVDTLTIASGVTLTNNGTLTNDGTIDGSGSVIFSNIASYNNTSDNADIPSVLSNERSLSKYNGLTTTIIIDTNETITIDPNGKLTINSGVTLTNNGSLTTKGYLTNNGTINGTGTIIFDSIRSYNNTSDLLDIKRRVNRPLKLSKYNGLKTTITIGKNEKLFINKILNIDKDVTLKINGRLQITKLNNNGTIIGKYHVRKRGGSGKRNYVQPKDIPFYIFNGNKYSYEQIKESLDNNEPIYLNDVNYERITAIIDFVSYDNIKYAVYITDKLNTLNNIFNEYFIANNEKEMENISNHYERQYHDIDLMFKYIQALKLLFANYNTMDVHSSNIY